MRKTLRTITLVASISLTGCQQVCRAVGVYGRMIESQNDAARIYRNEHKNQQTRETEKNLTNAMKIVHKYSD